MRWLVRLVLPTVTLLALLEGVGYLATSAPPESHTDRETLALNGRFYEPDPDLIVRLRPNAHFDYRSVRAEIDATMSTNAAGFRVPEWTAPDPEAFRILVLGDSVTFGLGLDDGEEWPASLGHDLREPGPARDGASPAAAAIQIRNLAVPGYSTFQGRVLAERFLQPDAAFRPHLVICGFGFNDGYFREVTDKRLAEVRASWFGRLAGWLREHSWFGAWLLTPAAADRRPTTMRVSIEELRVNLAAIAAAADRVGAEVLWADTALPFAYARSELAAIARKRREPARGVPPLAGRRTATGRPSLGRSLAARRRAVDSRGSRPRDQPTAATRRRSSTADLRAVDRGSDPNASRPGVCRYAMMARVPTTRPDDGIFSGLLQIPAGAMPEVSISVPGFGDALRQMRDDVALLQGIHLRQPGPQLAHGQSPDGLQIDLITAHTPPWPQFVLMPDNIHANAAGSRVLGAAIAHAVRATTAWRTRRR